MPEPTLFLKWKAGEAFAILYGIVDASMSSWSGNVWAGVGKASEAFAKNDIFMEYYHPQDGASDGSRDQL